VRRGVHCGDEIAHLLEFVRHRGYFGRVGRAQGSRKPGGKAYPGLNDPGFQQCAERLGKAIRADADSGALVTELENL
jgi:hypothetical protein